MYNAVQSLCDLKSELLWLNQMASSFQPREILRSRLAKCSMAQDRLMKLLSLNLDGYGHYNVDDQALLSKARAHWTP